LWLAKRSRAFSNFPLDEPEYIYRFAPFAFVVDRKAGKTRQRACRRGERDRAYCRRLCSYQRQNGVTQGPACEKREKNGPNAERSLILEGLKAAGDAGISVKDLAAKLGLKRRGIHTWLNTTGKKMKEIQKPAKGLYKCVGITSAPEPTPLIPTKRTSARGKRRKLRQVDFRPSRRGSHCLMGFVQIPVAGNEKVWSICFGGFVERKFCIAFVFYLLSDLGLRSSR